MTRDQLVGHAACTVSSIFFGLNIVFCKDISNAEFVSPSALFAMRAFGAMTLFWIVSLFLPHESLRGRDLLLTALASLLGLFVPQMTFLAAVTMTSAIDTSLLGTLSPIMTMFIAALALHEPITGKKVGGVLTSCAGVVLLILSSATVSTQATRPLGVVLMLCNCLSFAIYLGAFRPLIARYRVVTFMKWMFLFAFLYSLPFATRDLTTMSYGVIPTKIWLEIGYVILFSTFFSYFLIPLGQKKLRPTVVSMYNYVQPLITALFSILIGVDVVTWQKVLAALLVMVGVTIVNRSRAKE